MAFIGLTGEQVWQATMKTTYSNHDEDVEWGVYLIITGNCVKFLLDRNLMDWDWMEWEYENSGKDKASHANEHRTFSISNSLMKVHSDSAEDTSQQIVHSPGAGI